MYVNASVDDGTEMAKLMRYFKTADPNDMSQGELSKRVHFLKCEEGGYDIMCEISEKIYREGEEEQAKKTALNMHKRGYSDETIAELLEVNVIKIQHWLAENMSFVK